jgi:DNA polymerase III subunit epsilon
MTREIVLDTETTGLDPKNGDRVIEVACLELVNHFPTSETFHRYIDPGRDISAEAFAVHGLSAQFLAGKPKFADIAREFLEFVGEATLIIHNAGFDVAFLNAELTKAGEKPLGHERVLDTLALARRKHPAGPNSLDGLCKRYGIDTSSRTKHGALIDCGLLASVYLELIGGHQAKLDLAPASVMRNREIRALQVLPTRSEPLAPRLTEAEKEAHLEFLKTLTDPLWFKAGIGGIDNP